MKTIEIDDELFGYLQSKAIPFVETPNLTLRRIVLGDMAKPAMPKLRPQEEDKNLKKEKIRRKQAKADLSKLIRSQLLVEGQTLYLYDYQGNKINGYEATISGKGLLWGNKLFSMSELAKELLKKEGFGSESVRGPAHWFNSDGISVKELWKQCLTRQ